MINKENVHVGRVSVKLSGKAGREVLNRAATLKNTFGDTALKSFQKVAVFFE